jgi:hypothetical protein
VSRYKVLLMVVFLLALALALAVRSGGCDRAPPDDDEPVPACDPTDNSCKAGHADQSGLR